MSKDYNIKTVELQNGEQPKRLFGYTRTNGQTDKTDKTDKIDGQKRYINMYESAKVI